MGLYSLGEPPLQLLGIASILFFIPIAFQNNLGYNLELSWYQTESNMNIRKCLQHSFRDC